MHDDGVSPATIPPAKQKRVRDSIFFAFASFVGLIHSGNLGQELFPRAYLQAATDEFVVTDIQSKMPKDGGMYFAQKTNNAANGLGPSKQH